MKLFLQRLISVKPQNGNSLFIIYKGRVDAHKSFPSFPMAEKAPETRQCRYFKVSLLEGSFAEMCKERCGWRRENESHDDKMIKSGLLERNAHLTL